MSDDLDLEELAVLADAGDEAAAAAVVAATQGVLTQVIGRLVASQPVLDGRISKSDVVQSVYRWYFTQRDKTRPPVENVLGLLIEVGKMRVRHQSKYHGAKKRTRRKEVTDPGVRDGLADRGRTPFSAAVHGEDLAELEAVIGRLTVEERELLGRVLAGETRDDLADAYGVSVRTISRWLVALRDRIRTLYGKQ